MDHISARSMPDQRSVQGRLTVFGALVVGVGVILTAIGSISLFCSWGTIGGSPYYWAAYLGISLVAVGSAFTEVEDHTRINLDLSEELTPAAMNRANYDEAVAFCEVCRATNPAATNFCNNCGTRLGTRRLLELRSQSHLESPLLHLLRHIGRVRVSRIGAWLCSSSPIRTAP